MSPEWEFLYLSVHAARHGLYPFKFLVDLDWLRARGVLDWKQVQEKASGLGWERTVQTCLAACAALFETRVPERFAEKASVEPAKIHISSPGPLDIPRETIFSLRLLPAASARLQYVAIRLLVPTAADYEFIRLPSALFFLYYFLRPWRLAAAVVRSSMQAGVAKLRRTVRREATRGTGIPPV